MIGGHVIICDDIRHEVGGKTTYVGCYSTNMVFDGALPATLPKLSMAVIWYQTLDEARLPIDLEVYFPGLDEPYVKTTLKIDEIEFPSRVSELEPSERQQILEIQFTVSPVELKAGEIRVLAIRAGKRLSLRRIDVVSKAPQAEATPSAS